MRWIDYQGNKLEIRQIRVPVERKVIVSEPKTATSRRSVPLDTKTVAVLKEWRTRQGWERKRSKDNWTDTGLIFTREDGKGFHPQSVSDAFLRLQASHNDRLMTEARKRWESEGAPAEQWEEKEKSLPLLPRITVHGLRHSWATAGLRAGINPKVVSERLGHSTISITLDTYSSVLPSMGQEAAELVAAMMMPRVSG
ncbi:MAG: tyrosine-type recombinase/integrase [Actinobacteria bacterium]|nr:tyrosine-type recombinase/integrase [Actinomycetota bacterium]